MSQERVKTALIGVGKWGRNVARELRAADALCAFSHQSGNAPEEVVGVPQLSVEAIASATDIQAAWIATPIDTHTELVRTMIESGKHVMCEKPLAGFAKSADELVALANSRALVLATGYIFIYHPVYRELKRLLHDNKILRVECVWNKYGTFRESIEMNLLTHHLSIAYDLFGMPNSGAYTKREGGETVCDKLETELSYTSIQFFSKIDRVSKEKAHRVTVETADTVYTWEGVTLKKNGATVFESMEQPLALEVAAFLSDCTGGGKTATRGSFGANILRIHELIR